MASLLPGYEYDVFISYRQKDNKGDRWVSEFVDALKIELESTFKEEISVYFDINPHDGLLETHDVDASLKDKLNCLVFIPVISRTYCDPKSFAWEHEFKAFVEMASKDQFGLKVKLSGGNVANRVLPVQIHDLDSDDRKVIENELGGFLRGIEFIYREAGVNKPLTSGDDEKKNLNNTKYIIQINKVANAVKEIITGLRNPNREGKEISKGVDEKKPSVRKNLKTKIIAVSFLFLALIIAGYFIIPKLFDSSNPVEKSIAVLPFINDSPDKENAYCIDGIMDETILNLQKISDFSRVLPRTSVEQFRGETRPSIPEIAKKLNVNYIVQGSGKKYRNKFVLGVQLIAAHNEKQLWGKSYEQEIYETSDMINIESQIAQSIAAELKAKMTPKEKQLIEKIPTTNLSAYYFYQKGREEHTKYWTNNSNRASLQKAEDFYHKALKYDSTYAQAYTGLAMVYWDKNYFQKYFSENFMDSVLTLTNKAISLENQLSEAYTLRGKYYNEIGKSDESLKEFDKALQLNPNDWMAYMSRGRLYSKNDFVKSLENYHKAISLNRDSKLPVLFREISWVYCVAGFRDKAEYFNKEALKLDNDSLAYNILLGSAEETNGNYSNALSLYKRSYALDTNNIDVLWRIGNTYVFLEKYSEGLKWFKRFLKHPDYFGNVSIVGYNRIGLAFWKNGFKDEARLYFEKHVNFLTKAYALGRAIQDSFENAYDIAGIDAFFGEKEKAYEKLRYASKSRIENLYFSTYVKHDATFESYRNDPVFQQYVRDVDSKYQAEHERVMKWMEEQGKP